MKKPHPFMLKIRAFHFGRCEVGQLIHIEGTACEVTKIISVEVIAGELLKVIGMCREVSNV